LFEVGLSLEAAIDQPHHLARQRIGQALARLDDTVGQIRDHVFTIRRPVTTPGPAQPGDSY